MSHVLKALLRKMDGHRYTRNIKRALALHLRGEVRNDGLIPSNSITHLDIEWRARDIHPWDRGLLSPAQKAEAFVEQSLADTEAAIYRLFDVLPQVDLITLRVFGQTSEHLIISGTVCRLALSARDANLSIGMRLLNLGLTYHSAGSLFEALDHCSTPAAEAGRSAAFRPEESLALAMYRSNLNAP